MQVERLLLALDHCQHFFSVAFGLHFLEDVLDLAFGTDQEGRSRDPHDFLAVHVLFFDDIIGITNLLLGVSQQGVGQVIFLLKFLLLLRGVGGDAEDYGTRLLNFFVCVTKLGRLNRSTRSVGFGIKEQDDGFAAKIL